MHRNQRSPNSRFHRSFGLRAVFPAGGAAETGSLFNDVATIRLGKRVEVGEPHLLKALDYFGADAFNRQKRGFIVW